METLLRVWSQHLANFARIAFWLLLAVIVLLQLTGSRGVDRQRAAMLGEFERERDSRVIAMIHRQESASLFGVPVTDSISIDDSEAVLRAIRHTPPEQPIDIILHTPGGLVLAAEQIAKALVERKGKVTVFVPHYAMSGGTLIALAADEIVMDANAVLGPVDPQIGDMPAARVQVASFVVQILLKHMPEKKAVLVATVLSEGRWTHDFPITVQAARQLGLKVSTEMPRIVYDLMELYPQSGGIKPSVWYVPLRRAPAQAGSTGQPSPGPRPEGKSDSAAR